MATPRGNRQKDVYSGMLPFASQSQQELPLPEINEIPPSSALRTVSSTPRNGVQNSRPTAATVEQTPCRAGSKLASSSRFLDMSSSSADHHHHHHHHQFEQPGLPSPMMSLLKPKCALNSSSSHTTIMKSSSNFFASLETPSKPTSKVKVIHTDASLGCQETMQSTPIIKRLQSNNDNNKNNNNNSNNNIPLSPTQNPGRNPLGGTKNEISIYKTLGWDDEIDDLL